MASKILIAWKNSDSDDSATYAFDRSYTVGDYTVQLLMRPTELQGFLDQTESTIESGDFIFDEGGSFFNYPVLTGKTFSLTGSVIGEGCDYDVPYSFWESMLAEVTGDDGLGTFDLYLAFGETWETRDTASTRTIEARLTAPATTTWTGRSSFDFSLEIKSEDTGWEGTSESISIWDPITVEAGKGISVTASGTTYTVATTGSGEESYGTGSSATGTDSTAIGASAVAGDGSTALGSGADASAEGSDALGAGASAEVSWAVAVGAGSVATTAETVSFGTGDSTDTATYVYILVEDDEGEETYEVTDMESLADGETYYVLESDGSYTAYTYEDSDDEDETTYVYVLDDDGNYVLTDMESLTDGETYYVLESDGSYTERTYEESDSGDSDDSETESAPATRRLVNVSEGEDGTDAVNVDQLTEVEEEVDALGTRVTNVEAELVETQADVQANADAIANIALSVPTVSAGTSNVNIVMTDATDEVALDYAVDVTAVSVEAGDNVTVTSAETTETTVDENGNEVEFATATVYTVDGRDTVVAAGDNITVAKSTNGNTTTYTITGEAGTSSGSGEVCIGTTNCLTIDDDGCLVTTGSLGNTYTTGIVMGTDSTASGDYSSALGYGNTASGYYSSAVGYRNTASANYSSAVGNQSTASNGYTMAVGYHSHAYGYNSFAAGIGQYATSSSEGTLSYNYAYGMNSTAVGISNIAGNSGYTDSTSYAYQTAVGYRNTASGDSSSALGRSNTASGSSSLALGRGNTASGSYSSAVGNANTASGSYSSALGRSNTASGSYSSAVGYLNTASGTYSSAVGRDNTASGNYSSAVGYYNTADGAGSLAVGYDNIARESYSSAVGYANDSSGYMTHVFGDSNTIDDSVDYSCILANYGSVGYSNRVKLGGSNNGTVAYYGTLVSVSDERDKSNVEKLGIGATEFLNAITPVTFGWNPRKPCTKKEAESELSNAKDALDELKATEDAARETYEDARAKREEAERGKEEYERFVEEREQRETEAVAAAAEEENSPEDGEIESEAVATVEEAEAVGEEEPEEVTEEDVAEAQAAEEEAGAVLATAVGEREAAEKVKRAKEQKLGYINAINSYPDEPDRIGFTAQNIQEALSACGYDEEMGKLVIEDNEEMEDFSIERLAVNYIGFIPILVKAVQELSARIDELEAAQS